MNPGELNRRVKIYGWEDSENEIGATERTAVLKTTVWAKIEAPRQKEMFEALKTKESDSFLITIRYRTDIEKDYYLTYKDHKFLIQAIIDKDMAHKYLQLYCIEKTRGGGQE